MAMTKIQPMIFVCFIIYVYYIHVEAVAIRRNEIDEIKQLKHEDSLNFNSDDEINLLRRLKRTIQNTETPISYCGAAPCGYCAYDNTTKLPQDYFENPSCVCREFEVCILVNPNYNSYYDRYYCRKGDYNDISDSCRSEYSKYV